MSETLGHDGGKILVRIGDPAAGTHGIFARSACRFRLIALPQGARRPHDELAELDNADVGRSEMFPGAVLDRTLAVLDGGVLLAHAHDAGEALRFLLRAVEHVVIANVAHGHIVYIDLGVKAEP